MAQEGTTWAWDIQDSGLMVVWSVGVLQVNDEASEKVLQVEQKYNKVRKPIYVKRNDVIAKVADFWKTAFLHHPVLADLITEDDEEALHYLREVREARGSLGLSQLVLVLVAVRKCKFLGAVGTLLLCGRR